MNAKHLRKCENSDSIYFQLSCENKYRRLPYAHFDKFSVFCSTLLISENKYPGFYDFHVFLKAGHLKGPQKSPLAELGNVEL